MRISTLKWAVPAAMVGVVVLWIGGCIGAENSEAFKFARGVIRNSPVIREQLGAVESVRLSPWGFSVAYNGADADAEFECKVKAQRHDGTVFLRLHRDTGVWEVRKASLDGQLIELDTARVATPDSVNGPSPALADSSS